MSQQPPVRVAGVSGGVGTTTVAAALGAADCGWVRGGWPVEVVVCANTAVSTGRSHQAVAAVPGRPVLVVVAMSTASTPKPARSRIELVRPHVAAVVEVPFVARWREVVDPYAEAMAVLSQPSAQLPKHLRGVARALRQAREQLGQLTATPGSPPLPPGTRS